MVERGREAAAATSRALKAEEQASGGKKRFVLVLSLTSTSFLSRIFKIFSVVFFPLKFEIMYYLFSFFKMVRRIWLDVFLMYPRCTALHCTAPKPQVSHLLRQVEELGNQLHVRALENEHRAQGNWER